MDQDLDLGIDQEIGQEIDQGIGLENVLETLQEIEETEIHLQNVVINEIIQVIG